MMFLSMSLSLALAKLKENDEISKEREKYIHGDSRMMGGGERGKESLWIFFFLAW